MQWFCEFGSCVPFIRAQWQQVSKERVAQSELDAHRSEDDKQEDTRQRCMSTSTDACDASTCDVEWDMAMAQRAMEQLCMRYPDVEWDSFRSCQLHVCPESGSAGLILQATPWGYCVDEVEEYLRQDESLQRGMVIVCIDGCSLVGLEEPELEKVFGKYFGNGAWLSLLKWSELCAAEIQRDAIALGEWHEEDVEDFEAADAVSVASPVLRDQHGQAELIVHLSGDLSESRRQELQLALARLSNSSGSVPSCSLHDDSALTLRGDMMDIRGILEELGKLIRQHGLTPVVEDELFIKMLRDEESSLLRNDLLIFSQNFGIVAELCCPPHEDDSVVLLGDPAYIRAANSELRNILHFHGVRSFQQRP